MLTAQGIKKELAKRNLIDFICYTFPDYKPEWFHIDLCRHVQQFYIDVFEKGIDRKLMIFAPPRAGKSEPVSKRAPAWAFGRYPHARIMGASNSHTLSAKVNKAIQRNIMSPLYKEIFPNTKLNDKSSRSDAKVNEVRNVDEFEVIGYTESYKAASVGQGIAGFGASVLICDDPYGNRQQAESKTQRESIWDWWNDDFTARLNRDKATGVMLMHTRWHEDDLAGRLQELEADNWDILVYPAIATEDDEFRKVGESLCPRRLPLDYLLDKRSKNSYGFESLYQQSPTVRGGNLFKDEWWQYYDVAPKFDFKIITADTAQKTGEQNDYSVFQCWGKKGKDIYLIDQLRGKWEAPELKTSAIAFWNKHKQGCRNFYIEDKSSGTGLIQDIRRSGGIPIKAVPRTKDKITRAMDVLGYIESGYVFLNKNANYLSDLLAEASAFPNGGHDDQLDPLMDAIQILLIENQTVLRPMKVRGKI